MTPRDIIEKASKVLGGSINLDPCPSFNPEHHFAENNWVLGTGHDSLHEPWSDGVFLNPPFGTSYVKGGNAISAKEFKDLKKNPDFDATGWEKQTLSDWAFKFRNENGSRIWLSKAAVEIAAIQDLMKTADVVHFPRRRVNYLNPETGKVITGATFASMIIYCGTNTGLFKWVFNDGVNLESINGLVRV